MAMARGIAPACRHGRNPEQHQTSRSISFSGTVVPAAEITSNILAVSRKMPELFGTFVRDKRSYRAFYRIKIVSN
jgi:hypothetical protein